MAHIFKRPDKEGNKGILHFTHKELAFFTLHRKSRRHLLRALLGRIKTPYAKRDIWKALWGDELLERQIIALKKKYFVGFHLGWVGTNIKDFGLADYWMCSPSENKFVSETTLHIPISSRNFIPSQIFHRDEQAKKTWDLICVTRNILPKRLDALLLALRKFFDSYGACRVLLLVPTAPNEDSRYYQDLEKDYYSLFSAKERDSFVFLRLSEKLHFPGVSQEFVSFLFRSSKVFCLFSEKEGGPKVISEALGCGLKVVAYSGLKGGGLDLLNENNSFLFDSYETAHLAFKKAIDNFEMDESVFVASTEKFLDSHSIPKLHDYFHKMYRQQNMKYDEKLLGINDRIDLKLCAHTSRDIPWAMEGAGTGDIFTRDQFSVFLKILGEELVS